MTLYLVSGDPDILPSHEIIRQRGKLVSHDDDIGERAGEFLTANDYYILVAHGGPRTVRLFRSTWGEQRPWLFVGMSEPPQGIRLYLYSCSAGLELPDFLDSCEAFGHVDRVPMPTAGDGVCEFLAKVEEVLHQEYDRDAWASELASFVNQRFVSAIRDAEQGGQDFRAPLIWTMLRKSLGSRDG